MGSVRRLSRVSALRGFGRLWRLECRAEKGPVEATDAAGLRAELPEFLGLRVLADGSAVVLAGGKAGEGEQRSMSAPPDGLPLYRVLTGPDDAAFCRRVSEAIALGYRLHEGPAVTFNGEQVIVAQALLWPGAGDGPQG